MRKDTRAPIQVVSYFAVFLCGFAPLREPSCIKRQAHAKTPRRKDAQSQNKTLPIDHSACANEIRCDILHAPNSAFSARHLMKKTLVIAFLVATPFSLTA